MNEFRCKKCNRLMFIGNFVGNIQIKCSRCDTINEFDEHIESDIFASAASAYERPERHPIQITHFPLGKE